MAELGKLQRKKLKKDWGEKSIFFEFRNNKEHMKALAYAKDAVAKGYNNLELHVLKVCECDAKAPSRFSNATCYCTDYIDDDLVNAYALGIIFKTDWKDLEKYLAEKPKLPKNKECYLALKKLLEFLSSSGSAHKALTTPIEGVPDDDCEWTVRLAENLLSKLAVEEECMIDGVIYHNQELKQKEKYSRIFGDTSFGVPDGWHGRVDILTQVPVSKTRLSEADEEVESLHEVTQPLHQHPTIDPTTPSSSANNSCSVTSIEFKSVNRFADSEMNRILSQSIVFSFLQKKKHPSLN